MGNCRYVVWQGRQTGIFKTWEECKMQTHQFKGPKFKSFATPKLAHQAWEENRRDLCAAEEPILESIAVDAAWSINTRDTEYQGVCMKTGKKLFHKGPLRN